MRVPRKFCIEQLADEPDRKVVLEELVPLLEAPGLSPSQALDYWIVEDTKTTHGTFTQKERAEIRDVSQQAIGGTSRRLGKCLTGRQMDTNKNSIN